MLAFGLVVLVGTATPCESLKMLSTPQVIVVGADVVPAGIFTPPPVTSPPPAPPTSGGIAAIQPTGGRGARGGAPAATPPPPEPIPQHCRVELTLKPSAD